MAMQFNVEKTVSKLPEVALMYSKTGTAEVAFPYATPSCIDDGSGCIIGLCAHGASGGNRRGVQKPLATVVIGGNLPDPVRPAALYRIWHRKDAVWTDKTNEEHLEHPETVAD